MENIKCNTCKKSIDKSNIDISNMLTYCSHCDTYEKLTIENSTNSIKASLKNKVKKPRHIKIIKNPKSTHILINVKNFSKVLILLSISPIIIVCLLTGVFHSIDLISALITFAICSCGLHFVLTALFRKRRVIIDQIDLSYQIKSYYQSKYETKFKTSVKDVKQIYVKSRKLSSGSDSSTVFDIVVKAEKDAEQYLIKRLSSHRDALYIEQFIEAHLDITDSIQSNEAPSISAFIPTISEKSNIIRKR